jgi:hypothetical protein
VPEIAMKKILVVSMGAALFCVSIICFGQIYTEKPGPDEDWPHAEKAQHQDLDAKLRSLAGRDAIFCGHPLVRDDFKSANDCALRAFSNGKAFYVAFDRPPFDSLTSYGLARNSTGQMYYVEFDSIGFSPEGLSARDELSDNSHILMQSCPTPYQLLKDPRYQLGRHALYRPGKHRPLICFPPPHHEALPHP